LIPGQGGFVDQLDSVIFAAPIFYQLTKFFYT
jgi:phosphatidate cytidylyltransferase